MNAACALLLLFVEEAEAVAEAGAVAEAVAEAVALHSAHKQKKRRDLHAAIATQKGKHKWERRRRLVGAACTGAPRVHHSLTPCLCLLLPLLSCLSLCSFSWSLC